MENSSILVIKNLARSTSKFSKYFESLTVLKLRKRIKRYQKSIYKEYYYDPTIRKSKYHFKFGIPAFEEEATSSKHSGSKQMAETIDTTWLYLLGVPRITHIQSFYQY